MLGSSGVGKTSIITRLLYDKVKDCHQKTFQDMYCGVFDLCGEKMILDIEDTSGTFALDFPAMLGVSVMAADAVLLVFDVTREESFEEVSKLRDLISSLDHCGNIPIIVLANKTDKKWIGSADELEATVRLDWECGFVECSALDSGSVDLVLARVVSLIKKNMNIRTVCDERHLENCLIRRQSFPEMSSGKTKHQKKKQSCNIS